MATWLIQALASAFLGVIVLILGWTARTLLEAARQLAVHEEKHERHDERLKTHDDQLLHLQRGHRL
jgi:hypothetical protein